MNPEDDYRNSPTIPDRYKRPDSWPHAFAPGESRTDDSTGYQITKMYCTYCHRTYWMNKEPRPVGVCPARNDKSEYRRLGVD